MNLIILRNLIPLLIFSFFSISCLANNENPQIIHHFYIDKNNNILEQVLGITYMNPSSDFVGCSIESGIAKISSITYDEKRKFIRHITINDYRFKRLNLRVDYEGELFNSRGLINNFFQVGRKYFFHTERCGSGGVRFIINVFDVAMDFNEYGAE